MMADFAHAARDLLVLSAPAKTFDFDGALYGSAIVRPSRSLSAALTVDRELAVLFSNFDDQQQRTVRALQTFISESAGRLEPTVAIVVHPDHRGNAKLRNWGRDGGLSILPVFRRASLPAGEDLKRLLCFELYSHDIFDVTGPVSDDNRFYGRRSEAQSLARKLQTGQICSCLGIRKIGKTSLINRIIDDVRRNHDCIAVMVDCSRDDVWSMSASALMSALAEAVESALSQDLEYETIATSKSRAAIASSANRLRDATLKSKKPVIIFIDEVDYITPGSPTGPHWARDFNVFWRSLRSVYQEIARGSARLSLLVAGVSSHWFTVEAIDGIENAALALIPEEYVSPLPRGATTKMLQRLGKSAGLQFAEAEADRIAKACGDIPYWSRKACSYIHRNIDVEGRPVAVRRDDLEALLANFIHGEGGTLAQVALQHLFRVYPALESVVELCGKETTGSVPEHLVRVLRNYGVLSATGFDLSGEMMREGFRLHSQRNQPDAAGRSAAGGLAPGPAPASLNDWAEDLAVVGKRRNILERSLRAIVLNFIRFDAISKKSTESITTRIAAALPNSERAKHAHLSGEQLLDKFLWTNLTALIVKEWRLFETVFGDQAKFKERCAVVNDRPDAHAKHVDAADLALYRRSLEELENAVKRLQ
jgi:hypothetical protein